MKKTLILLLTLICAFPLIAQEIRLQLTSFPSSEELQTLEKYNRPVTLTVCCSYPTEQELATLKHKSIKSLTLEVGYFPTATELEHLTKLSYPINLKLAEVFPSEADVRLINQSGIDFLHIISSDFPTLGEVGIFNQVKKDLLFDITKKEFPTEEHMVVIRQFKPEIQVGFHNPIPPGQGYANFYNSLKSPKVFTITDKFPYGDDALGMNLVEKSSYRITPDQQLMEIDISLLRQIQKPTVIELTMHPEFNSNYFSLLDQLSQHTLVLHGDNPAGLLINQTLTWALNKKNLHFSFSRL